MAASLSEMRRATGETASPFEALLAQPMRGSRFDADAYHAMQARDSALIADSVLNGYSGKEYVYEMTIKGERVTGISVVGARALAAEYKGIKTRIVSAIDKTGPLFVMRTFDPPTMSVQHIPELADQMDFYEVVVEVQDLKTGNSIQQRKKEDKCGRKRDGGLFERPHFDVIAEAKAFRNGVLAIIPQDVVSQFEQKALSAGNKGSVQTKADRIAGLLRFAASKGVAVIRSAIEELTSDQIDGIGQAARESVESFRRAAVALGIAEIAADPATGEIPPPAAQAQHAQPAQQSAPATAPAPAQQQPATQAATAEKGDDSLDDWRCALADCDTAADCDDVLKSYRGNPTGAEFRELRKICEARKAQIAEGAKSAADFGGGE